MGQDDEMRLEALDLGNQARMLLAANNAEQAKQLLEKAMELDPMCADTYDHLGAWYMTTGDFKRAKEHFKKALLIDKGRGETYFSLGNACLLLDQLPECLDSYNRALAAGYDQAEMQFYMALAYEENKDYEMAIRHLNRAILKDQTVPDYRVKKAQLLLQLGKVSEAAEMAEEIISTCPELFDGYHLRTILLQRSGDYAGALHSAREAFEKFPEDVGLLLDYVRCSALAGNYDEAFQLLNQAKGMRYFEREGRAFGKLEAELYAQRGELDKAVEAAKYALSLEDGETDGPLHQLHMNLLMTKGDFTGLVEGADALIARHGEDQYYRAALYYHAMALNRSGKQEEAKAAYREAISIYRTETLAQPGLLDAYLYRAMAHKDMEEYEKALEMIDFLLALDDGQAEPHAIRAEIYKCLGRTSDEQAELERAWAIKPELREVYPQT